MYYKLNLKILLKIMKRNKKILKFLNTNKINENFDIEILDLMHLKQCITYQIMKQLYKKKIKQIFTMVKSF